MAFIEVEGLSKTYAASLDALHRVSFTVEKGEWIAVMGPSGSGKSTLLNILGGLDAPTCGRVALEGQEISQLSANELARFRAEKIGFVFQQFHLVPYLTALENVMLAQYFHSLSDEREAANALSRVGLGDRLEHLPSQLSGGEQQRVCVARALINQPDLILADEPTGNLDSENSARIMSVLSGIRESRNLTMIVVTHEEAVAQSAARNIHIRDGRICSR